MYEKLTKCTNFTRYIARQINKMPKFDMIFAQKIFSPIFGENNYLPPYLQSPIAICLYFSLLDLWLFDPKTKSLHFGF